MIDSLRYIMESVCIDNYDLVLPIEIFFSSFQYIFN